MRAVNHTVTGAVVGAAIVNPFIALPAALLSHLVLDAIPHSGGYSHTTRYFKLELFADAALMLAFLSAIYLLQPANWGLLIACGFLGAAPDFWWAPYWAWELQGKPRKLDPIGKFLSWIQWSETPKGYIIEVIWLVAMLILFFKLTA